MFLCVKYVLITTEMALAAIARDQEHGFELIPGDPIPSGQRFFRKCGTQTWGRGTPEK